MKVTENKYGKTIHTDEVSVIDSAQVADVEVETKTKTKKIK